LHDEAVKANLAACDVESGILPSTEPPAAVEQQMPAAEQLLPPPPAAEQLTAPDEEGSAEVRRAAERRALTAAFAAALEAVVASGAAAEQAALLALMERATRVDADAAAECCAAAATEVSARDALPWRARRRLRGAHTAAAKHLVTLLAEDLSGESTADASSNAPRLVRSRLFEALDESCVEAEVDVEGQLDDGDAEEGDSTADCPLMFQAAAIVASTPAFLLARCADAETAHRAWATSLVLVLLEQVQMGWRVSDANTPAAEQRTLADAATDWLHGCLGRAVTAALRRAATRQMGVWQLRHDARVTHARAAHIPTREHTALQALRAAAKVHDALLTQHPTMSLFTRPLVIGFVRWQGSYVLLSSILCVLVTNIWLYFSKASVCCADMRALAGCGADPTPCLGFVGSCGELADWPALQAELGGPYVCTAFPADDSARDSVIAGILGFAIALPVAFVINNCFGLATATDDEQLHGRTRWMSWSMLRRVCFGAVSWRLQPDGPPASRRQRVRVWLAGRWCAGPFLMALVNGADCVGAASRALRRAPLAAYAAAPIDPLAYALDTAEADRFGAVTTRYKHAGFAVLYLVWAFFAWIIIACASRLRALQACCCKLLAYASHAHSLLRRWAPHL
jgi:hypothetical protein